MASDAQTWSGSSGSSMLGWTKSCSGAENLCGLKGQARASNAAVRIRSMRMPVASPGAHMRMQSGGTTALARSRKGEVQTMKTLKDTELKLDLESPRLLILKPRGGETQPRKRVAIDAYLIDENGSRRYHDVYMNPAKWTALVESESEIRTWDALYLTGTLCIPEEGEPLHKVCPANDRHPAYEQGYLTEWVPSKYKKGCSVIKAPRLTPVDKLEVFTQK